jgi:hypothetical protein
MAERDQDDLGRPLRGVVEVEWDGWEQDPGRSRAAMVIGALLVVLTAVVVALVLWALGSEAELPPSSTTTTEVAPGD